MSRLSYEITTAVLLSFSLVFASCGSSNVNNAKNAYPQDVVDAFLQSCEQSGSKHEMCSCALDKTQQRYTFEEFSVIESKIQAGRTPDDFVEFMGKARAACMK
jgi:hypothetical protein